MSLDLITPCKRGHVDWRVNAKGFRVCRQCNREATLEWQRNNPEKYREKQRRYRLAHLEDRHEYDRQRAWTDERREAQRRSLLARKYGLTQEDFERILASQDYRCAICHDELTAGRGGMAVDHDHETGEVRGILCCRCNKGLGHFRERLLLLKAAVAYLERTDPN